MSSSENIPNDEGSFGSKEGLSLLASLQETVLSSPFNIFLTCVCGFIIYRLWKSSAPRDNDDYEVIKVPPPLEKHDMDLEELKRYDGRGPDGRVCIAINGFVYDCSKSHFYRPGGPYSSFAGRDATRGLATFEPSAVSEEWDDYSDLTPSQISSVQEWEMQFRERYELVGKLVKDLNAQKGDEESDKKETNKSSEDNTKGNNSNIPASSLPTDKSKDPSNSSTTLDELSGGDSKINES